MPTTFKGVQGMSPLQFLGGIPGPAGVVEQLPLRALEKDEIDLLNHLISQSERASGNLIPYHEEGLVRKGFAKSAEEFAPLKKEATDLAEQLRKTLNKRFPKEEINPLHDLLLQWNDLRNRINELVWKHNPKRLSTLSIAKSELGGYPPKPFK